MANFLQIKARTRVANTLIDTFTFSEMEIREGISKLLPYMPAVVKTAEGYAKTYPRNMQTQVDFTVFLEVPATVQKLGKIMVYMNAGYVFVDLTPRKRSAAAMASKKVTPFSTKCPATPFSLTYQRPW